MKDLVSSTPRTDVTSAARSAATAPLPIHLIEQAVTSGQTDALERLMDLQERHEAKVARQAFFDAMAKFQNECPGIGTRGQADRYKYARLEDILTVITPILSECGLMMSFDTEEKEGGLTEVMHVHHVGGHTQTNRFSVPMPEVRGTNATQQMGAANSYARRYAIINGLNLRIMGEDNDGRYEGIDANKTITPAQAATVTELLEELGGNINMDAFLRFADAADVQSIKAHDYDDVMRRLLKRKSQVEAARASVEKPKAKASDESNIDAKLAKLDKAVKEKGNG